MPTLQERFDQSLDERIVLITKNLDTKIALAFELAKEIQGDLNPFDAIALARHAVDAAWPGYVSKKIDGYKDVLLQEARNILQHWERQMANQIGNASVIQRSKERSN